LPNTPDSTQVMRRDFCICSPERLRRYQGRISGPLRDRIDLQVQWPAVSTAQLERDWAFDLMSAMFQAHAIKTEQLDSAAAKKLAQLCRALQLSPGPVKCAFASGAIARGHRGGPSNRASTEKACELGLFSARLTCGHSGCAKHCRYVWHSAY